MIFLWARGGMVKRPKLEGRKNKNQRAEYSYHMAEQIQNSWLIITIRPKNNLLSQMLY